MNKNKGINYIYNDKIRLKITDKCNLSCPFCHCEGTKSCDDVSLTDENFKFWIKKLRKYYNKIHLTGGEPTLYNNLPQLCEYLRALDYEILITTNLLSLNKNLLNSLALITRINISLHSLDPDYFKNFLKSRSMAENCLARIKKNILDLKDIEKEISINTVVSNREDQNLEDVLHFCRDNKILLKLVPDWRYYEEAKLFIRSFLNKNGFVEEGKVCKVPGSNLRIIYKNGDQIIEYKDISPYYLSFWCENCKLKDNCIETYAFLRLEGDPLRFKICIGKESLSKDDFERNYWKDFNNIISKAKNSTKQK